MTEDIGEQAETITSVTDRYDYRLTPYLRSLLKGRPANDPLSVQFAPDARELKSLPYEIGDPIGDRNFSPVEGIVHRYPDRVLLKVAHSCPVYCRFCFRREMVGRKGEPLQGAALNGAIDYIRAHREVWEVILTGGDPLTLSARRLRSVLGKLAAIETLDVVRIHTRVPIVAPDRIDDATVAALQQRLPVYMAVHVNHADELTEQAAAVLSRLSRSGVALLSQTVLLKGVNDSVAALETLFRQLVTLKVRPYYLHHPDLAPGTSHFRVSLETGQELMRSIRGRVSGTCLPTYVLDIPGGFGKVPVEPFYVGRKEAGSREIRDSRGGRHQYPE
jgi:lysine 2,3-aminomutase